MDDYWQEFELSSEGADKIRGRITTAEDPTTPIVLMATGDGPKGSKSLTWTNIVPIMSSLGLRSCLFDFRGLGFSEGDRRELSITSGIADIATVVEFIRSDISSNAPVGCFASSFGAAAVTASHSVANQFDAIAFKSPASYLPESYALELSNEQFESWMQGGYSEQLGFSFSTIKEALGINVYNCAEQISTPLLITHGTSDDIVPFYQSILLKKVWGGNAQLSTYEGVSHNYSEPGAWDKMANEISTWLAQKLKS